MSRAPDRLTMPLLALATVVAALARLPFLGSGSLWFDETYTVRVIRAGSPGELWERIGGSESTPPLFYALTWLWAQLAGDGEAAVRTVSAVALIAAVPVSYAALRRLTGERAALGAAFAMALSPVLVEYGLDARAYGLLVLTSLLSVWAFAALLERDDARGRVLWALAAASVIWTHYYGGFLVLAEVVVLLWLRPAAWRATVLAAGGVLLALLPLLPLLSEQTGDERAGFIGAYDVPGRLEQLARHFAMGARVPATWLEAAGLAIFAAGVAVGAALALRAALGARPAPPAEPAATPLHKGRKIRVAAADPRIGGQIKVGGLFAPAAVGAGAGEPPAEGARALLGLTAVGLLVPLALAVTDLYDRFSIRNVLFLLPLAAGLAAIALTRLRAVPLLAYLALSAVAVVWAHTDWRYEHSDWRAAIEQVSEADPDEPVIASTPLGQPVASLYLDRAAAPGPLTTRRAWLVVEPVRPPGDRALGPVTGAAVEAPLAAAFPTRRERTVHGFRVIELEAPAPVTLDPGQLPGATLYPGRG